MAILDITQRTKRLFDDAPAPHRPETTAAPHFEKLPFEWSAVCIAPAARTVAKLTIFCFIIWLSCYIAWNRGWIVRSPLQPLFDIKLGKGYADYPATGMVVTDSTHVVVATDGGGVHSIRTDAANLAVVRTFNAASTDGALSDDNVTQIHLGAGNFFFVGRSGSLTTARQDLSEFSLRFGGSGFRSGFDLTTASVIAVAPNDAIFGVGTARDGFGLYDGITRRWVTLDQPSGTLPSNVVTAALINSDRLWVGTDSGLRGFRWHRGPGGVELIPASDAPPEEYRSLPVGALFMTGSADSKVLECVLGRGAHLRLALSDGKWSVAVNDGDSSLSGFTSPGLLSSLIPGRNLYLSLPSYGPARYDVAARSLKLMDDGLPGERGHRPEISLASPDPTAVQPALYLLMGDLRKEGGAVYRLDKDQSWGPLAANLSVRSLAFVDGVPTGLIADGTVRTIAGVPGPQWFAPLPEGSPAAGFGPGDAGSGRLVLGTTAGKLAVYSTRLRGWSALSTASDSPVREVRLAPAGPVVAKTDGEAGSFSGTDYTPIFGTSALSPHAAPISSAAPFNESSILLRDEKLYVYDPSATVRAMSDGLPGAFHPGGLLFTAKSVFLDGQGTGGHQLYRASGSGWSAYDNGAVPVKTIGQLVAGGDLLAGRSETGEILVQPDNGDSRVLLAGTGVRDWKKLVEDAAGHLIGLTRDKRVLVYSPASGNWSPLAGAENPADLVMNEKRDQLCVGGSNGVQCFQFGENPSFASGQSLMPGVHVRSLEVHSGILWVLEGDDTDSGSRLWSCVMAKCNPQLVRDFGSGPAPSVTNWTQAVWAGLARDRLMWLTPDFNLWRYDLSSSGWTIMNPVSGNTKRWEVAEDSTLWWQDSGGAIRAYDLANDKNGGLDINHFDASRLRSLTEISTRSVWIALAVAGIFGVFLVLGALFGWDRPLRSLVIAVVFAVAGLTIFGARQLLLLPRIERISQFTRVELMTQVTDFAIPPGKLVVRLGSDCYSFSRKGTELSPDSIIAGCGSLPESVHAAYPQRVGDEWELSRDGQGYRLRRNLGGSTEDWQLGSHGFEGDAVEAIAFSGDRLLAATEAGWADLDANQKARTVRLRAMSGAVPDSAVRLFRSDEATWGIVSGGAFRFTADPSSAPIPLVAGTSLGNSGPIRWSAANDGDHLEEPAFDSASGRFIVDISSRVERDAAEHVWVETRGGWRIIQGSGTRLKLSPPGGTPNISDIREWQLNPRWRVRVQEGSVRFTFVPSGYDAGADPFGARGRLPDENARFVAFRDGVWLGTPMGLRLAGSEEIFLPGREITGLDVAQGRLFCRTADGVYVHMAKRWERAVMPDGTFAADRHLEVEAGPGISITATEHSTGAGFRTQLADFDSTSGRFVVDEVAGIEGNSADLWVATASGIDRMRIGRDGVIENQTRSLNLMSSAALRRDARGVLCAFDGARDSWRFDGSRWDRLPATSGDNPFFAPVRGAVSRLVSWERTFGAGLDTWRLVTSSGQLGFTQGKLDSDFVVGVASGDNRQAEITHAGLQLETEVVPLPAEGARVGFVGNRVVARTEKGGLTWSNGTWRETREGFLQSGSAIFDDLAWHWSSEPLFSPSISWRQGDSANPRLLLNTSGMFPFDTVHAVTTAADQIYVLHDDGIRVYGAGTWRATRKLPAGDSTWISPPRLVARPDGCVFMLFLLPEDAWVTCGGAMRKVRPDELNQVMEIESSRWSGPVAGSSIELKLRSQREVTLRREGEEPQTIPLDTDGVAVGGGFEKLWVLTPHRLYRLDEVRVPHVAKEAPSAAEAVRVYFDFRKAVVRAEDEKSIVAMVPTLLAAPLRHIIVEGHADPNGDQTFNQRLARQRANAVVEILIRNGVQSAQIDVRTVVAPNQKHADNQEDRRADISLSPTK